MLAYVSSSLGLVILDRHYIIHVFSELTLSFHRGEGKKSGIRKQRLLQIVCRICKTPCDYAFQENKGYKMKNIKVKQGLVSLYEQFHKYFFLALSSCSCEVHN